MINAIGVNYDEEYGNDDELIAYEETLIKLLLVLSHSKPATFLIARVGQKGQYWIARKEQSFHLQNWLV